MSKAPNSPARPQSRSYSRSRSRSLSRSRSRKRHYSSRSRSRSRSHSPSYRNYPSRDYQSNRRGFRGYGYKSNWHSRSRTPKKRSGSRSRSRYSDRSSSGQSRHSRRSSYSSRSRSRSSSPRHRSNKARPSSKESKEKQPESPAEKSPQPAEGNVIEKASGGKWIDFDASPKRGSPGFKKEEVPESKGPGSGGPLWKTVGSSSPPAKSPTKSGQTASFSGFGFFAKEEAKAGDNTVISAAFKKFMADNKNKKASEKNSREKELVATDREPEKSSKSLELFSMSSASYSEPKEEKVLPFFNPGEEEFLQAQGLKDQIIDEELEAKPTLSARDIFGKWGDEPSYSTSYLSVKEQGCREPEEVEDDMEEELYRNRKHVSKKEEKSKKKEKKEKEKPKRSMSPPTTSRDKERPLFPGAFPPREQSPVRLSVSRKDFELKISSLDDMPSSSLSKDHLTPRDLLQSSKKDPEFRSIFQHIQSAQLHRSPSELFAQHIVSIVHYIKAHHFRTSDMSLSERFAMYQRKAAEAEMMRKSPEIHRRIDVSPSAFKRHTPQFEDLDEMSYKEPSKKFKGDVMDLRLDIERRKRFAGKERDNKREGGKSPGGSRGPSRERSSEKSGKHHKKSKKSKKKRERSHSSSSSSSPSLYPPPFKGKEYLGEGMEHPEEGFSQPRYPPRDYSGPGDRGPREYEGHGADRGRGRGFFPRVRGRGWTRGNYPGNSNGNPPNANPTARPQEEEWDPEYTPKSRKYYLHDDRDGEKTWMDNRGRGRGSFPTRRGRFLYRRGSGGSPKWTHDMFQGGEEGELGDDGIEDEHKGSKSAGDLTK
ncbi:thyroid hormone receptor-associated protein 3b isoform X2 [Nematolebias whitei]|uniref:thyroid hormone receptor-associated protein 3b isoform X2 n=1 Tax=Nematolebias whitei TaxID=451745 RepID=UPI0018988D07|nr:thyroid hormone receptor-associated protein 3b isoform X2 [Nematolebias whitei]